MYRSSLARQRGFSAVEWSIATLVVIFALFVEMPVVNESSVAMMGRALRELYQHVALLLSLP